MEWLGPQTRRLDRNYRGPEMSQQINPQPDWFGSETITIPAPKPQRSKKSIIIAAVAVGIAIIVGGIALFAPSVTSANCLDAEEYAELTDNEYPGNIDPRELFYSYPILFQQGTTQYDNSELPKNEVIIQYLGEFYKKHSDLKPVFTLRVPRLDRENWYLSQDRMDLVQQGLIAAGIPADSIVMEPIVVPLAGEKPNYDDESDGEAVGDDSDEVDLDTLTISITSPIACKE